MTRVSTASPVNVLWPMLVVLLAAALVQIYAGLELAGLYGDGAYCLRRILSLRSFACIEPARGTTQYLLELPTVLGVRLGVTGLYAISAIFSLTLQLVPLVLTCCCYAVLPIGRRILFALPVFDYFAGSSSVASIGLLEGPTATAAFWVVLFVVLFTPERRGALLFLVAVAIPAIFLHEVLLLLGPFLAAAAWWRSTRAASAGSRLLFRCLIVWFLIVCAVQAGFVIYPFREANRDGFFAQFFGFMWIATRYQGFNVPAVLGLLAILAIAVVAIFGTGTWAMVVAFGIVAAALAGLAMTSDWYLAPISQFYARNHPAMMSMLLAPLVFAALLGPFTVSRWASHAACAILVILAAATLFVQTASVRDWSRYVQAFRATLQSHSGIVVWEELMPDMPDAERRLFTRMNWGWTTPDLSLLLSEGGQVRGIVTNPKTQLWQPWDPLTRAQWPTSAFFVLPD
jgi:hypothetical protein